MRPRCLLLALGVILSWALATPAGAGVPVVPNQVAQGQSVVVSYCLAKPGGEVRVRFLNREFALFRGADGCWHGAVAADLEDKPGNHRLIFMSGGRATASAHLRVVPRDYGVRNIKVAKKYTAMTAQQVSRHRRERRQWMEVVRSFSPIRHWRGAFLRPVPGPVTGDFGRRSVINGLPRKPHSGVDLRGTEGSSVRAAAMGRVALVMDGFFSGHTVLVDHGQGLITRYLHLSQVGVKKGQQVAKGQEIGKVGATGRVTGPHLDYGVTLAGARVDPLAWQKVSATLARKLGGG